MRHSITSFGFYALGVIAGVLSDMWIAHLISALCAVGLIYIYLKYDNQTEEGESRPHQSDVTRCSSRND